MCFPKLFKMGLAIGALLMVLFQPTKGHGENIPLPLPLKTLAGTESGPIRISMGFWLADISKIDSAAQTFSANLFMVARWRDKTLIHEEPQVKRYNLKDIWQPTLIITNAASSLVRSFPDLVEVGGDGTVTYRQRFEGSFSQPLDLRSFPFDSATFRVQFVSVGNTPAEIQFVPYEAMVEAGMPNGAGMADKITLQDWRLTGFTAHASPYPIAPKVELAGYVFEFQAQRLKQHYVVKVISPLLMIVMMSWMVFWLDESLGSSQISVAVTSMLTLIAYRFAVGTEVPKLPYLTDLDAFILLSSMLVFLVMIEVVVTSYLWVKEKGRLSKAIDRYCRIIFPVVFVILTSAIFLR